MNDLNNLQINHLNLSLSQLTVQINGKHKSKAATDRNTRIILPDGSTTKVGRKFWTTFCSLHDLNRNFTHYFSYKEVFDRISEVTSKQVRLTIEKIEDEEIGTMVACTSPKKPVISLQEAKNLIDAYDGTNVTYNDGVVQASFQCPFPQELDISGDMFKTRFALRMPLDGYGLPCAYLELLRSKNLGAIVGYTRAFKTTFQLGKNDTNLIYVLDKAMTTFNNEEGYHAFKKRLEAAAHSYASFYEAANVKQAIRKALLADDWDIIAAGTIFKQFDDLVGNPLGYYGITNSNELSDRKAKTIPVNASIYQIIVFTVELATHVVKSQHAKDMLFAWIGEKISAEMDLEGTLDTVPEFNDFFLEETKHIISPGETRVIFLGDNDNPIDLADAAPISESSASTPS